MFEIGTADTALSCSHFISRIGVTLAPGGSWLAGRTYLLCIDMRVRYRLAKLKGMVPRTGAAGESPIRPQDGKKGIS